jgi:PII-like signaling protein
MRDAMTVDVTMFLREAELWHRWSWRSEILNHQHTENVYTATVPRRFAGFLERQPVWTSQLVDAGGKLPVFLYSVDADGQVNRLVPTLKEMAAHRLIMREKVVLEQGILD